VVSDDLARRRVQYETAGLDEHDVDPDPFAQWRQWYRDADEAGLPEPHAMVLATVDTHGRPDCRYVLTRGLDERGFTFYTNYESAKSRQLDSQPVASALFTWLGLHRQARVAGRVERVSPRESDAYFASRPRESQIGAWASPQSEVLTGRAELERRVHEMTERFAGSEVPRPDHWGGWRLVPDLFEFWQGRPSRLHDRVRYRLDGGDWVVERLAP
jgi:pyridoxamine 5'-phosphate oxidase